ncbi:uncharacterized protein At3g49055 [Henckelia pumila]|uniref:uncharacterized protein At3g49055 n=1 Tax=Henckelia pumila TaxID=405737 RepID=UPI003C6E8E79
MESIESSTENHAFKELESLRLSCRNLGTRFKEKEMVFTHVHKQNQEYSIQENKDVLQETAKERGCGDEIFKAKKLLREREEEFVRENGQLKRENGEKIGFLTKNLEVIKLAKDGLMSIISSLEEGRLENFGEEHEENEQDLDWDELLVESNLVLRLINMISLKLNDYKDSNIKERRELEIRLVNSEEENKDINSLLRIALMEKEELEKNLGKLKGENEQKRMAILQIAEKGLQKVGFGFIMGSGSNDQTSNDSDTNSGTKSDDSERAEEVVNLASAMEKIMKNLRQEIADLRSSLQESRLETEQVRRITFNQHEKLAGKRRKIEELEETEAKLIQNVEALLVEIKETEEDARRWRDACELEAEAGKNAVMERDKLISILKQGLEKNSAALDVSNGKLKLKNELVSAADAAREAAERSLQLADSRAAGLRERIEELTKQLEDCEKRSKRRIRYICWPFPLNPANSPAGGIRNVKQMVPEMLALDN